MTSGISSIYLDGNATMPAFAEVIAAISERLALPLNPSSVHASGRKAKALTENARLQVKKLLGAEAQDYNVIFTSSGTEANNLIVDNFKDAEIFISAIEHVSLLSPAKRCAKVQVIKVTKQGMVDLAHLEELLSNSTQDRKLVSAMLANNETGIIQPIKEVAGIARKFGALVHSDCAQAIGKIAVDVRKLGIDFATFSGHKFGAGPGAGGLVVKTNHHLMPMMMGGGQERGARSGTENVPAIVACGIAAEIAALKLKEHAAHMVSLQSFLESALKEQKPQSWVVGQGANRLPNTSLIITPGATAQKQLIMLDLSGIAVSSGAACSSGKVTKSHVLQAMEMPEDEAKSAIRVSTCFGQSQKDIEEFIKEFVRIV